MKNNSLKNNIFIKRLKCTVFFVLLFAFYFFICAYSYVNAVSTDISSSVFRLHVLANSNSDEDQNLKLLVRDEILEYTNNLIDTSMSREEVISTLEKNINSLYDIAYSTIKSNGYDYDVNINIGNFLFPTKSYGDISLPAGYYDGIRIEIGKAEGNNWWCVMFPPLCFVDVTSGIVPDESKEVMQDSLSSEEYQLVSEENVGIKFKFKLIELFNSSPILTAMH